jgi:transcriptional regulator with XRE-family HTH domain
LTTASLATRSQPARHALAERLRGLRRATGATGGQFAERLGDGWGQPKVSKIETGKQLPTAQDIEAWARAARVDPSDLLDLLDRARIEFATFRQRFAEFGGADRFQDAIGAAEFAATRLATYEPLVVPGILQTADYARELLHLPSGPAQSAATDEQISRMIASRLRRQAILYETGRDITLLMGEGALRTRLASAPIMRAQREHIARLAETLTTATIAIVPFTAQAPIATLHGWGLTDDLATIETDAGHLEIADPQHVEGYWHNTRLLLDTATIAHDTATLCRKINDETATP